MKEKQKQATAFYYNKNWKSWDDVYNGHYDFVNTTFAKPNRKRIILRLIDEYAGNKTLRMIDIGCGTGVLMRDILERGHYAVGVDIAEKMVQAAREATSKLFREKSICLQADIESLPFENGSFDSVICAGVLSHQPSDHNSFKEISRLVKKGGIVIITLPNILKLQNLLDLYRYFILLSRFFRLISKISSLSQKNKPGIKDTGMENDFIIRKYYYGQLNDLFRVNGLNARETVNCGFGPFTFWRKEIFPYGWSMKLSGVLERLAAKKLFGFLKILTNSWVICLKKIR